MDVRALDRHDLLLSGGQTEGPNAQWYTHQPFVARVREAGHSIGRSIAVGNSYGAESGRRTAMSSESIDTIT